MESSCKILGKKKEDGVLILFNDLILLCTCRKDKLVVRKRIPVMVENSAASSGCFSNIIDNHLLGNHVCVCGLLRTRSSIKYV